MALTVLLLYYRPLVSHVTFIACFPQTQRNSRDWIWKFLTFANKPMHPPLRPLTKVSCEPIYSSVRIMGTSRYHTLSHYAAFLARSLSASSIPAYLNIVRILHLEHGLEDPSKNNFHLATTLRGIRRCKGHTVSRKKPMTPDMLLAIKEHLNLTDPLHANFWAVCLVGFFGLLHKANMLLNGIAKFNPLKNLRRGDIVFYPDWVIIVNRWSKTIQFSQ